MQLTDYSSDRPAVSPDGKWIGCFEFPGENQPPMLALVPFSGGEPRRTFPLPAGTDTVTLRWTPDGRALTYIHSLDRISNIWEEPVTGGHPKPVTHFVSDTIFYFDWSRDGRLALSRGTEPTDAVLLAHSFRFRGAPKF